jgi:hypothetical protein
VNEWVYDLVYVGKAFEIFDFVLGIIFTFAQTFGSVNVHLNRGCKGIYTSHFK